jgi:hypothetical protein
MLALEYGVFARLEDRAFSWRRSSLAHRAAKTSAQH